MSGVDDQADKSFSWFHSHCPGFLNILTVPYRFVIQSRSKLYEHGWLTQHRLPRPVVSVGNLTVGGTGKTPVVMWLANWFRDNGKRVGILSRGYRRHNTADCLMVSNGEEVLGSPRDVGDEPFLMAKNCPGVVVAVGKDRCKLGLWVLDQMEIDCFILDDGFQHLRLYRDCNLLLIDALDPQGLQELLPAGRLREPLSASRRATAIIMTRANQSSNHSEVLQSIESAMGKAFSPIYIQFDASRVMNVRTGQVQLHDWVSGKRAVIFSGIGNALSFRRTVEHMGVTILEEFEFPDHFPYSVPVLDTIRTRVTQRKAEIMLTTEKDAVKISPFLNEEENVWALCLKLKIEKGEKDLMDLLRRIPMNS